MDKVNQDLLPFFITAPGESDLLFAAVTILLILVVLGFGAMYFTIQAIPDRLVEGTSKAQMQLVGILGLVSLFTMNNIYWVAALLLAAIRLPDFVTPQKSMSRSLKRVSMNTQNTVPETPVSETVVKDETAEPEAEEVGEKGEDNA